MSAARESAEAARAPTTEPAAPKPLHREPSPEVLDATAGLNRGELVDMIEVIARQSFVPLAACARRARQNNLWRLAEQTWREYVEAQALSMDLLRAAIADGGVHEVYADYLAAHAKAEALYAKHRRLTDAADKYWDRPA